MSNEHEAAMTKPTGRAIFFRALRRDIWVQWLGANETPHWQHPRGQRWGVNRDGLDTSLYLGRAYINYGITDRRRAVALTDSAESVGEDRGAPATHH